MKYLCFCLNIIILLVVQKCKSNLNVFIGSGCQLISSFVLGVIFQLSNMFNRVKTISGTKVTLGCL